MSLRDHAKGRWPEIIADVLGEQWADKRKHQPCPTGQGTDCYRFSDVSGAGNFFCRCSQGERDGFDLIQCVEGVDFATAAKLVEGVIGKPDDPAPRKPEHWSERYAREAETPARSRYLEARGLSVPPSGVRFHRAMPYMEDGREVGRYPAMLASMQRQGVRVGLHVTYLDGACKADVHAPRKILSRGESCAGASVALTPPAAHMGIAEGIETALSATALFGIPTWSALNTSLLKQWQTPQGVERVTVFADHDRNFAGHAAAYGLAHRLARKGVTVDVRMPSDHGDWNDVLLMKLKTQTEAA